MGLASDFRSQRQVLTAEKIYTMYCHCVYSIAYSFMGKRKKKSEKSGKDEEAKLVVRIEAGLRDAFIEACQERDTTASREVRRFIRDFLEQLGKDV